MTKNIRVDRYIGELSYPLYMVHMVILQILFSVGMTRFSLLVLACVVAAGGDVVRGRSAGGAFPATLGEPAASGGGPTGRGVARGLTSQCFRLSLRARRVSKTLSS